MLYHVTVRSAPGFELEPLLPGIEKVDLRGLNRSRMSAGVPFWAATANSVKYQFSNPTAGAVNLASGTVRLKCRPMA